MLTISVGFSSAASKASGDIGTPSSTNNGGGPGGCGHPSRIVTWTDPPAGLSAAARTVTPAALPDSTSRIRISGDIGDAASATGSGTGEGAVTASGAHAATITASSSNPIRIRPISARLLQRDQHD